jgi:hypothetical protein
MDIWEDRFTEVCRRHHDLVAVYESPRGRLALLLRQTLVPLGPEHFEWLAETRATVRAVVADLRTAGFDGATVVLQWLPFGDVANIVSRWVRRWDGDQVRRTQLLAVVDNHLADQRFLDTQAYRAQRAEGAPALQLVTSDDPVGPGESDAGMVGAPSVLADGRLNELRDWYARMAPCWLAIEPPLRRRLVLQTHAWIAERVLADSASQNPMPASNGLEHDGMLARLLGHLVAREDRAVWGPWIELVRVDLQRALTRPPARRTEAWARWLFFIPYSVPTPRRRRRSAGQPTATVPSPA